MAINGIDEKILFQRHNPSKTPGKKGSVNPYLTKPEDLLREDNAGVLVVDPNKVLDPYNEIKDRYIKQEDLIMYASLKVYKRGNSSVVYNSSTGAKDKDITNEPIYINFLNPLTNVRRGDGFYANKGKMTSEWTDFFTSDAANDRRSSEFILDPETFGITNISIKINANNHPIITVEFTDVQGRVLFERGNDTDNPYNIFYTYPYPKFSLRYKGYFGKAVEVPLVLIKSNTRFDPSTGNYNITAEFQSDVFSIFNTFLIIYAYVAPYMFKLDSGEYLGGKILRQLYEAQNAKIRQQLNNDDEFEKYEIKNSPTLWDLAGALKNIPVDALNQSGDTDESVESNEILLSNKAIIENYEANIRDYFVNNPEAYGQNTINGEIIYTPITSNSSVSIENKQPLDFFDQIQRINDAIKNISSITVNNGGSNFTLNLTDAIKKNDKLKTYYTNKVNVENLIEPSLFLYKLANNTQSFQFPPITLDPFNIVMGIVFESLAKVQAVIEDEYINDQVRDLGVKLGYQPNLSNILRIISNNMQTFITMLDIMGKSANNQLKVDTLRLNTQGKFSDNSKEFGNTIYSAFPNYFKSVTEFKGNDFVNRLVLSYPGADSVNNNWFEVRFVEEIYEALDRIKAQSNPPVNGIKQQRPTSLLSVFQLGENDLGVYPTKEYSRVLGEVFARYAIYMSYSGLLYRGITNFPSNVSSLIADFEVDLMVKNVFSKIQTTQNKFVVANEIKSATGTLNEDGTSYTNLGNFGIKFIGFGDRTLTNSLNVLTPIFSELSGYTNGTYTEENYNKTISKLNNLFKSPSTVNSSGQTVGIKNKFVYDMLMYKKSGNDINLYSTIREKKTVPLKHFIDLRSNNSYYCDNSEILTSLSDKFKSIDGDKVNKNSFQGLYINMNNSLKDVQTSTDMSRGVNYGTNDNVPALTFNTDSGDYSIMGNLSPFKNVTRTLPSENFYSNFNKL